MSTYRAGTVYMASENVRPWVDTSDKKPVKPKPKKAVNTEPVFIEYAEIYKDDTLLFETFQNASNGKLPYGFTYRDGQLIFKHRKNIKYLTLHSDSNIAAKQCAEFMQNGGIFSKEKEVKKIEPAYENIEAEMRKKTKLRDELVRSYMHDDLRVKYNMTRDEELQLFYLVLTGFLLDRFSLQDIEMGKEPLNCQQVVKLHGLDEEHFEKTRVWRYNPELQMHRVSKRKTYKKRPAKPNAPTLSVEYKWSKHVNNIDKRNKKADKVEEDELSQMKAV